MTRRSWAAPPVLWAPTVRTARPASCAPCYPPAARWRRCPPAGELACLLACLALLWLRAFHLAGVGGGVTGRSLCAPRPCPEFPASLLLAAPPSASVALPAPPLPWTTLPWPTLPWPTLPSPPLHPHRRLGERLGSALAAAAVAQYAAGRLDEAGVLPQYIEAVRRLARDEDEAVKCAAGKAAGRLVTSELEAGGARRRCPALCLLHSLPCSVPAAPAAVPCACPTSDSLAVAHPRPPCPV
jgi:hypothetical protein